MRRMVSIPALQASSDSSFVCLFSAAITEAQDLHTFENPEGLTMIDVLGAATSIPSESRRRGPIYNCANASSRIRDNLDTA